MQSDETKAGTLRFRKLRIAWSVFWGMACVLLVVLWVRSYWATTALLVNFPTRHFQGQSVRGRLSIATVNERMPHISWHVFSDTITPQDLDPRRAFWVRTESFASMKVYALQMPFWVWLLLPTAASASPWIPWSSRFSVRTLLIATTLVAVVLGAIVYVVQ
jgi:hypothetical protein